MLEHDILAVQQRLSELESLPEGVGRQYNERELQGLRESGPALAGKLALHEILADKLMGLERAALQARAQARREGHGGTRAMGGTCACASWRRARASPVSSAQQAAHASRGVVWGAARSPTSPPT